MIEKIVTKSVVASALLTALTIAPSFAAAKPLLLSPNPDECQNPFLGARSLAPALKTPQLIQYFVLTNNTLARHKTQCG